MSRFETEVAAVCLYFFLRLDNNYNDVDINMGIFEVIVIVCTFLYDTCI